jgi:threonine/homoserine/homoserine lactone efflux protein
MSAPATIVIFLLAGLGILLIPGLAVLYILTQSAAQGSQAHQADGV